MWTSGNGNEVTGSHPVDIAAHFYALNFGNVGLVDVERGDLRRGQHKVVVPAEELANANVKARAGGLGFGDVGGGQARAPVHLFQHRGFDLAPVFGHLIGVLLIEAEGAECLKDFVGPGQVWFRVGDHTAELREQLALGREHGLDIAVEGESE